MMIRFFKNFCQSEDGAVTVDWVVLTALVVGLAVFVVATLRDDANSLSSLTQDYLEAQEPGLRNGNIQDVGQN